MAPQKWEGVAPLGLDTPTQQAAPPPTAKEGQPPHFPLLHPLTRVVLELPDPRSSSARGPGPPGAFGLVVCAQSFLGTLVDRNGRL